MNVFVAENSVAMDKCLQSVLSDVSDVTVVGHSVDERDAIEHIDALQPDAVILDFILRSGSGISVLENIKKHHPEIKVMMLASDPDDSCINRCRRAGADCLFDRSSQLAKVRAVFWQWVYADRIEKNHSSGTALMPRQ